MTAPAIEQVVAAVVARLEAVAPTLEPTAQFSRADEDLEKIPAIACFRRFEIDPVGGSDDSQEGNGVVTAGVSDRRARFELRVAYPRTRQEHPVADAIASDAEHAMRSLGRSADWNGTPIRRTVVTWTVDRARAPDRLFLVLALTVQYRDVEQ